MGHSCSFIIEFIKLIAKKPQINAQFAKHLNYFLHQIYKRSIYLLFCNEFNKFNNTGIQVELHKCKMFHFCSHIKYCVDSSLEGENYFL